VKLGLGLHPLDLIKTAKELLNSGRGKIRQSNLRRAQSSVYYALFHTLARCCADTMIGGAQATKSTPAWRQVYRALDHGPAKSACQSSDMIKKFPKEIQDFANLFATMQEKRHEADYDPDARFAVSEIETDIGAVESAIADLVSAPIRHRRAFAVWVLLKNRK
jgi:hypothetical protein